MESQVFELDGYTFRVRILPGDVVSVTCDQFDCAPKKTHGGGMVKHVVRMLARELIRENT